VESRSNGKGFNSPHGVKGMAEEELGLAKVQFFGKGQTNKKKGDKYGLVKTSSCSE
tara:strand:- start:683 stop:850 length:168 start_codon:yes stop_codon:yes gene_type:complete